MVDVSTIANVATALTVIVALAFGVLQIRDFRHQRREAAAFEALRALQSDGYANAVSRIWILAPGARARDVATDPATLDAAILIANVCNAMGYMVERGYIEMEIADEMAGSAVVVAWARLERWVLAARRQSGAQDTYSWFEKLAKAIGARRGPAYMAGIAAPSGLAPASV